MQWEKCRSRRGSWEEIKTRIFSNRGRGKKIEPTTAHRWWSRIVPIGCRKTRNCLSGSWEKRVFNWHLDLGEIDEFIIWFNVKRLCHYFQKLGINAFLDYSPVTIRKQEGKKVRKPEKLAQMPWNSLCLEVVFSFSLAVYTIREWILIQFCSQQLRMFGFVACSFRGHFLLKLYATLEKPPYV